MSPKWTDSRAASPRTSAIFFPDSDSTPSLNIRDQGPPERAMPTVDLVTDPLIDLPPYVMGHDVPTREREQDTDSVDYK